MLWDCGISLERGGQRLGGGSRECFLFCGANQCSIEVSRTYRPRFNKESIGNARGLNAGDLIETYRPGRERVGKGAELIRITGIPHPWQMGDQDFNADEE